MARVVTAISPVLVLATASLLGTFSSVFMTVGQFFHLLAFQTPI